MRLLDAIGVAAIAAFVVGLGVLVAYVALVKHPQSMQRVSTAIEEPHDEAPVPVMYRLV